MRKLLLLAAIFVAVSFSAAQAEASSVGGNATRGKQIYERCAACHSLARNRTGPKHCGLFGRAAGRVPGFDYSPAMRESGIVWNTQTLDRFLEDPLAAVPGTYMGYAGVKDAQERADLIAFLEKASGTPDLCR